MLVNAVILFAIAAVGGLAMAILHFRGRTPPPVWLAVLHGLFAACGLVVLLLAVMRAAVHGATVALVVLLVAALGGFTLVSFHVRRRALPNALVIGHALIAVAGFAVLLAAAWALIS
jgi:hypothetical protein